MYDIGDSFFVRGIRLRAIGAMRQLGISLSTIKGALQAVILSSKLQWNYQLQVYLNGKQ